MDLKDYLTRIKMSQYHLSKESGVPQTTISDICSNQSALFRCSSLTLYKIAKVLNISIENLLCKQIDQTPISEFEIFKSNICHECKYMESALFIEKTLKNNDVEKYFKNKEFSKAFYLIAMVDYLSRLNHLKRKKEYMQYREMSLLDTLYPQSITLLARIMKSETYLKRALKESIPEFKKFNIVEKDVENVN